MLNANVEKPLANEARATVIIPTEDVSDEKAEYVGRVLEVTDLCVIYLNEILSLSGEAIDNLDVVVTVKWKGDVKSSLMNTRSTCVEIGNLVPPEDYKEAGDYIKIDSEEFMSMTTAYFGTLDDFDTNNYEGASVHLQDAVTYLQTGSTIYAMGEDLVLENTNKY